MTVTEFRKKQILLYAGLTDEKLVEIRAKSTDAAIIKACSEALGELDPTPRRCMHHRTYPDSPSGCHGEPSDYCQTDLDARIASAIFVGFSSENEDGDK